MIRSFFVHDVEASQVTCQAWFRRAALSAALLLLLAAAGCGEQRTAKADGPQEKAAEKKESEHDKGGLKLTAEEQQRAGIKIEALRPQALIESFTVTAVIRANQDRLARVAPRVEGRIVSVTANLGDPVRAGQVLATLDSVALGEASSSFLQAQSAYRIAEADLKRAETLSSEEIIPQKDLLRARTELEKANTAMRAAQDKMRLLGAGSQPGGRVQSVFPVTAPFTGTVIQKKATLGELATPSEPLFTIADLSKVWIEANLTDAMLAKVRAGTTATVTVSAYPEERFNGKVTYVASGADKETRSIPARIEVDNRDGRLKLDMFATATIHTGSVAADKEVLTLPDDAVVLMQGQPTVFVEEHGGFEARAVDLGEKLGGRTIVKSGLAPGDSVVVAGAYALKARALKAQIGDSH